MNRTIENNYSRLKLSLFLFPFSLLLAIFLFLYTKDALTASSYIQVQKDFFFFSNHHLGQYPLLQINITQFGDAFIFLLLISIFIIYGTKIWESAITGLLVSLIFSSILKKVFSVPRPAAVFDHDHFIIIGKTLKGLNSLPSGHAMTIFTILTVLLFAYLPRKWGFKILQICLFLSVGIFLASSRVGVGAHYPFDVLIGSIIGYISGLTGIFINRKYNIWGWMGEKKFYPFFMVLFLICLVPLTNKLLAENLLIYYLSLISLCFTLYKTVVLYVKK